MVGGEGAALQNQPLVISSNFRFSAAQVRRRSATLIGQKLGTKARWAKTNSATI
jgi:hypothetical protein